MKKTTLNYLWLALFLILGSASCETENDIAKQPFVAAFETESYKYIEITHQKEMHVVFSEPAKADGSVRIRMTVTNAAYGVDFELEPAPMNNEFELPIYAGQSQASFVFHNLIYPFDSGDKVVKFEIIGINYPYENAIQGYTTAVVSFDRSLGATVQPELGGPNEGDQVYFDLSTETATKIVRDSWDLGFYGGSEFRVGLNSSIYMAAKKLDATDIDAVTQSSVSGFEAQVAIGTFDPANMAYVDAPSGLIPGTAIAEISSTIEENHVYLLNMGYTVGTTSAPTGSVAVAGSHRGWKKIRILRDGENYLLQYANLDSPTHEEVTIPKNDLYNFTFFSFNTNSVVSVEPEKAKWDLNFTVFTNEIVGSGSYGYADFVLNNLKAGARVYEVAVSSAITYENYALANVDDTAFTNDQRVIGADWRDVFSGTVYANRFYVLKDPDGNYYKIRMLSFLNQAGNRGYPKFEYKLLQ
jgi:hypothetical protein